MSLSDWASIAIIVQGALFIVSIFLVWYQLRENTKMIRTANTQNLVDLSTPFNLLLVQDRAVTALWRQGGQEFESLDEIDRERYFTLLTWWLMLHENIYHQWSKKLIDQDTFTSWTRDLEYFVKRQHIDNYWTRLNEYFEPSFAKHVSTIVIRLSTESKSSETEK